ncbi:MAG: NUDIX domain-containing protein [Clostridia bacterium]|nr:NUDIX domain-containing protein [Clostridia bacterium]
MPEIWDLYDADGNKMEQTLVRGEEVPQGLYHIGVHIWPINHSGSFLIQKRADNVQWKPGIWAATGGSAVSGEEPLTAAIRELHEELGISAAPEDMHLLFRMRRTISFCSVYSIRVDRPEDEFVLQKEEVAEVRWCTIPRMMHMIRTGQLYNYGDAYYHTLFEYRNSFMERNRYKKRHGKRRYNS